MLTKHAATCTAWMLTKHAVICTAWMLTKRAAICTAWMLTKRVEKKLDGNYARMLPAVSNKSSRQHPTKQQLNGHLPPITKTINAR